MISPFSYLGSMESPATSKAIVSSAMGKGSSTSPRPSGGTCSCSGSMIAPAPTRPMIGTEFSSRFDDRGNFRRLDQADFGQYLGNRARADAHRRCQAALGLARLLKSALNHPDIQ